MGFFTSEPSQYYQSILNTVPASSADFADETSNRIRQRIAQQVSGRGLGVGRGAYTSLVAREEGQAARDREARNYDERLQRARLAMSAPVSPSAMSQFASPLLAGVGYGMGPKAGDWLQRAGGNLWDMGAGAASSAYDALRGAGGPGAGFGGWEGSYADVMPAVEAAEAIPSAYPTLTDPDMLDALIQWGGDYGWL